MWQGVRSKVGFIVATVWLSGRAAMAVPAYTTDNGASFGQHANLPGYASLWMGSADYSVTTEGTNTYINSPSATGTIFFRSANAGTCDRVCPDPDNWTSNAWVNSTAFHTGVPLIVDKGLSEVFGTLSVFGYDASVSSPALYGMHSLNGGTGVMGDTITGTGVYGHSQAGTAVHGLTVNHGNAVLGEVVPAGTGVAIYGNNTSGSGWAGYFAGNINVTGSAFKAGGGSWSVSSDERIKKDVKPFQGGLAELERVRPVKFKYNGLGGTEDTGIEYVGVIAQELEKIAPFMVTSAKRELKPGDKDQTDIKQVDPSAFTYMLINAVQEQQKIIRSQEARLARLERAGAPTASSPLKGALGLGLALGLVPMGLFVARRTRRK